MQREWEIAFSVSPYFRLLTTILPSYRASTMLFLIRMYLPLSASQAIGIP